MKESEDQNTHCKIVSSRHDRDAAPMNDTVAFSRPPKRPHQLLVQHTWGNFTWPYPQMCGRGGESVFFSDEPQDGRSILNGHP